MKTCCSIIWPVSCWVTCVDTSGHVAWSAMERPDIRRQQSGLLRVSVARCPGHSVSHQAGYYHQPGSGAVSRVADSVQLDSDRLHWVKLREIMFTVNNISHPLYYGTRAWEYNTARHWPLLAHAGVWCCHALTSLAPVAPLSGKIVQFSHGSPHLPPARCLAPNW